MICLHGAGHSANSFAYFASLLKDTLRVASYDFRGHGTFLSYSSYIYIGFNKMGDENNLSQDVLIEDTITVLNYITNMFPEDNFIMLGHR